MTPQRLFQHFNEIAEAPDAVPRLRRFILDLAVRGKLVEQDPNDEPAAELLINIRTQKRERTDRHNDTKESYRTVADVEPPFEIPKSWEWVLSTEPAVLISDHGKKVQTKGVLEAGQFPVVDQGKVVIRGYCNDAQKVIRVNGPVIVFGDHTRETKLIDFDFIVGADGVKILKPIGIDPSYYFLALQWVPLPSRGYGRHFSLLRASIIPLPPLAEQHRIVAKANELMALCDELEAAQQKRERRRDRLVMVTLNGIGRDVSPKRPQSNGNGGFGETALPKFFLNHLPRLTTRPAHIQQLRQTILNLAMRGQLVPQDPEDEPASELLKRIQAAKARLEKVGKIKKERPIETSEADAPPFGIPEIWKWVRLGELTELITKGSSPKWQDVSYVSKDDGVLFVTSENVGNYRLRKLDELKYVEKRFNEIEPRSILRNGDILMNLVGASIGRTAVYDLHDGANINQAVALIRLIQSAPNLYAGFLLYYLNSPSAIEHMMASQVVNAQPNISLTNAREFPIPVPPLPEQHRIVAKVDELMALCDRLEAQLTTTQTESRRLLEAVLHQALTPATAVG